MNAQAWITLSAVIVALFGKVFWDWWNRPKIKFGLKNEEPHVITAIGRPPQLIKYFRIKMKNKGKVTAKNCYVKLISVTTLDSDVNLIEPDKLKWSSAPTDNRYGIPREKIDIFPSGGWEFCDLFRLDTFLLTDIHFESLGGNRKVPITNEYIITIEVTGDNIKPRKARIRTILPVNGFWETRIDWA